MGFSGLSKVRRDLSCQITRVHAQAYTTRNAQTRRDVRDLFASDGDGAAADRRAFVQGLAETIRDKGFLGWVDEDDVIEAARPCLVCVMFYVCYVCCVCCVCYVCVCACVCACVRACVRVCVCCACCAASILMCGWLLGSGRTSHLVISMKHVGFGTCT